MHNKLIKLLKDMGLLKVKRNKIDEDFNRLEYLYKILYYQQGRDQNNSIKGHVQGFKKV